MTCDLSACLPVASVSSDTRAVVAAERVDTPRTTVARTPSPALVGVCINSYSFIYLCSQKVKQLQMRHAQQRWRRSTVVERWSLTGELSLSYV